MTPAERKDRENVGTVQLLLSYHRLDRCHVQYRLIGGGGGGAGHICDLIELATQNRPPKGQIPNPKTTTNETKKKCDARCGDDEPPTAKGKRDR